MYHYFEPVSDTKGNALIGYYVGVVDGTGSTVPLYADLNLTPIISVSGVANMAQVDTDGDVDFYITEGTYGLNIYGPDAATLIKSIANVSMGEGSLPPLPRALQFFGFDANSNPVAVPLVVTTASGASVASRILLASISSPLASQSATVTEPGHEGTFVFSSANLSTQVAADPQQGVYVAPSSDTTGASGAWVRKFNGAHNVKWFGAVGDNVTNDGAAFLAALSYLAATSSPATYGQHAGGSSSLFIPKPSGAAYYLGSNTLDIYSTIHIFGEGVGDAGAAASVLRWDANTCGIRVHNVLTTGFNGKLGSPRTTCGDASIIEGLYLQGGYQNATATPEADQYPAIQLRARATVRDCFFNNWQGDGVYIHASGASGNGATPPYGNANNWKVIDCAAQFVRDCLSISGADSNAGYSLGFQCLASRRHGIWDDSFLGNAHIAPLTQSCSGTAENGAALPASIVSDGTYRYGVNAGQSVGASTNAPSTNANNTWWHCIGTGGVNTQNGIPLWTSGMSIREGFPYYSTQAAAANLFVRPYSEGSQAPSFGNTQTQVTCATGVTMWLRLDTASTLDGLLYAGTSGLTAGGKMLVNGTFQTLGITTQIGPQSGTSTNNIVDIDNTSTQNTMQLRSWAAGVSQVDGKITSARGSASTGNLFLDGYANGAAGAVVLRSAGTEKFRIDGTRATVASGVPLNLSPLTFATLPASPIVGDRAFITDCTVNTFGTAAAGSGSNKVPVYYDGAWKVG